jgi:cold shock CspA family protein
MQTGTISRIIAARGFFFITPTDSRRDLFAHVTQLLNRTADTIAEGERVEFTLGTDRQRRPMAVDVRVV